MSVRVNCADAYAIYIMPLLETRKFRGINQSQKLEMSWLSVVSVPSWASANAILFACVQTVQSKRYVMKIQFIRNATPTVNTTKKTKLGMIY